MIMKTIILQGTIWCGAPMWLAQSDCRICSNTRLRKMLVGFNYVVYIRQHEFTEKYKDVRIPKQKNHAVCVDPCGTHRQV